MSKHIQFNVKIKIEKPQDIECIECEKTDDYPTVTRWMKSLMDAADFDSTITIVLSPA